MPDKGICFVICPIGDPGTKKHERSDLVLAAVIGPACAECGYTALRADKIEDSGTITTQIIEQLINAPLVIADLTDDDPNVFYELAIRHAFRKPSFTIKQAGQRIPFDVQAVRTLFIDIPNGIDVARADVVKRIIACERQPEEIESPVSIAVDRAALRTGGPVDKQLAKVLDGVESLTASVEAQRVVNIAALEARGVTTEDRSGSVTFRGFTTVGDTNAFKELVDHFAGRHPWHSPDYDPDGIYGSYKSAAPENKAR